jgi:MFS family permease
MALWSELDRSGRLVLLGCLVCQMGLGCGYVFAPVLKHVVAEFEWSRAAFAAASAPLLLAMALSAPWIGAASERLGARAVLSGATLLLGLSLWLFSRMQSLWEFYVSCALLGVGLTGVGDVPIGAVVTRWVERGRGLALGLVYTGSNLGGAVVPVLATAIAAASSWRTALAVVGALAVAGILPFALGAVREPSARAQTRAPLGTALPEADADLGLAEALRTRSFWLLAFVLFSFYFYYLAVNQHLIAFLTDIGFSDARAAASFGGAVGLGVGAKLAMGALADRISRKRALLLNFGLLCAGSFALLGVGRPGLLPVFLVAHGFATAAENVLLPLAVVDCFGARHLARIYGALMLALLPGGVLGPVFAGAVFDAVGHYGPAFATFAALNLVALAALAGLRREHAPATAGPAGALAAARE